MSDRPEWIDDRLHPEQTRKLSSDHAVDTMLEAPRPIFSAKQLSKRVNVDIDRETARNRLEELRERDIVAREDYEEPIYYVEHPDSKWPLSPEGKRALDRDSPLEDMSIKELVLLRDQAALRSLTISSMYLGIGFFFLSGVIGGIDPAILTTETQEIFSMTAVSLLFTGIFLLLVGKFASWVGKRDIVRNIMRGGA
jgi:VIT1/CCC1 family predicted Fe2+/Mn2+ transporter